ncbi:UNVERIFIED_CONTAM: hypothetical protein ABID98_000026 [Brevibacillus sp. OAP136]
MRNASEFFANSEPMTAQQVVSDLNRALSGTWAAVFREHEEELTHMFATYGDRAYGVYIQKLMAPLSDMAAEVGIAIKPGFSRADSIENWGPPEERERCIWYALHKQDGALIGTAVLQFFHSHTQFHLPEAPRFFALEETERDAIIEAISQADVRLQPGNLAKYRHADEEEALERWEYATETGLGDYIRTTNGQKGGGYLDHALTAWGRNGWELVSVVPQGGQLVGFFKRKAGA